MLYLKKRAVIIPLPKNINPEQYENANLYKKSNLGKIVAQNRLSKNNIVKSIYEIQDSKLKKSDINKIEGQANQLSKAAEIIIEQCQLLKQT